MRKHLLAIALIITGAPGCDNVGWGGIDFEVLPPAEPEASAVAEVEGEEERERIPGPVLLAGTRTEERGDFVVVGEVRPDGLHTFPDPDYPEDTDRLGELTAPGAEWTVFSEGVRVGRLVVERAGPAADFCGERTAVSGILELVPSAAGAERLLALPAPDGDDRPREPYGEIQHVYDQRVASLQVAGEAIREYGARWPTQGVLDAREHIQAFRLRDAPGESVAATFVVNDQLAVAPPAASAWALFVVAEQVGGEYVEAFTWYRNVEVEGKGAPRYFDHFDWDGDGSDEILLDVFGANRRWFAALSRREGTWVRTFRDTCDAP